MPHLWFLVSERCTLSIEGPMCGCEPHERDHF